MSGFGNGKRARARQGPNGLRYKLVYDPHASSVAVSLLVRVGSRHEPSQEDHGVAHIVEHMLFRGTWTRGSKYKLLGPIYASGGTVNGETTIDNTHYWCRVGPNHVRSALDTLWAMVRDSKFDYTELKRELYIVQNELLSVRSDPNAWLIDEILPSLLYRGDPTLAHSIGGDPQHIVAHSIHDPDRITAFFAHWYQPQHMCLTVYGRWNTSRDDDGDTTPLSWLDKQVRQQWTTWTGAPSSFSVRNQSRFQHHLSRFAQLTDSGIQRPTVSQLKTGTVTVHRAQVEESTTVMAWKSPSFQTTYGDRLAQDVFMTALAETMISRLFIDLREDHGLVYRVSGLRAGEYMLEDSGRNGIQFQTAADRPQDLERARARIEYHRLDLAKNGLTQTERDQFSRYLYERLGMLREQTVALANWYGERWLRRRPRDEQSFHLYRRRLLLLGTTDTPHLQSWVQKTAATVMRPDQSLTLILTRKTPDDKPREKTKEATDDNKTTARQTMASSSFG